MPRVARARDWLGWSQCFGLVQTDKILSTFKWLAFELSDDAQAVFWRWMDAAAWKLTEELDAAEEMRTKEERVRT